MATMEEIAQARADVVGKEAEALTRLADHLRSAIVDLPAQSLVAQHFAHQAPRLEQAADRRQHMAHEVWNGLAQMIYELDGEAG